jgi:hypothetical protein
VELAESEIKQFGYIYAQWYLNPRAMFSSRVVICISALSLAVDIPFSPYKLHSRHILEVQVCGSVVGWFLMVESCCVICRIKFPMV